MRGQVRVAVDATQETVLAAAMLEPNIAKFVVGDVKKVIYVPNRLLNIVVG